MNPMGHNFNVCWYIIFLSNATKEYLMVLSNRNINMKQIY